MLEDMHALTKLQKDFSFSASAAGVITTLVGMTSSAIVVFQAASAFGASSSDAGSWLGSLCVAIGLLTIFFSLKYKAPVIIAWSTPGAVLLVAGAAHFQLSEAIGAFLFSGFLIFLSGITGLFAKIMDRISLELTSALLAGVLVHFCLQTLDAFSSSPVLIGLMFMTYIVGKKLHSQLTMLAVLIVGLITCVALGLFKTTGLDIALTHFHFVAPTFSIAAIVSLGLPLFIVTMASQNLTGLSVMRNFHFNTQVSPLLTGMGLVNLVTAFFGGFAINLAAITAAIAMGPEAHADKHRRYIAGVVAGSLYTLIGIFAASVTSLFGAFPKEMITAIAGLALLGTVSGSLEKALRKTETREASFLTFIIAASGVTIAGISAAFWAIVVGLVVQFVLHPKAVTDHSQ